MSDLMLDVDQAGELKAAFRRGDWTNAEIKRACEGDILAQFRRVVLGNAVIKAVDLLKRVATVTVGAVEKFVAADAFGSNNPDGIKFWLGDNFKKVFLGKIEENVEPATIAVHRLEKPSRDPEIMAELGIDIKTKKGVIKLAHFREMLKAQAQGQEGPLLVNGWANIAYIEDENGAVWAVSARWYSFDREWGVYAYSVGDPDEWLEGHRVLSQVS